MTPALLDRVATYLGRTVAVEQVKPPLLSSTTAAILSIAYTTLYVLPFYLHPTTRPAPTLSRDSPTIIQTRIRLVTSSVAVSTALTFYILSQHLQLSHFAIAHSLGFYPLSIPSLLNPLLLTFILFAGPLFENLVIENGLRHGFSSAGISYLHQSLSSWIGFRNYIAAPLTEELLFRSLILTLHLHTPSPTSSPSRLIFATPLYFGIAHIHHFYEFRLTHPFVPALPVLLRSLVQFAYTTVFGWYASFLYLRTGSVWGVVGVHAFCNWMGLPRVWGRVGVVEGMIRGKEDEDQDEKGGTGVGSGELGIGWTVAYYVCLVGGATAWYKCMWVLTECDGALVEF